MQWIIEFDGIVIDVIPVHYQAHRQTAEAVGWSWLDMETFRRLTRTKGEEANLLPGAKPIKIKSSTITIRPVTVFFRFFSGSEKSSFSSITIIP